MRWNGVLRSVRDGLMAFALALVTIGGLLAGAAMIAAPAMAQQSYPTGATGVRVPGVVPLQCNAGGTACTPAGASNPTAVQGNVASGTADSGNPVKIGGIANSSTSPPVLSDGQRTDAHFSPTGEIFIAARDFGGGPGNDGRNLYGISSRSGTAVAPQPVATGGFLMNGTSWDRMKKPSAVSRLLSAAASTNATLVKASSADLFQIDGQNVKAAAVYLKLYNKATAPTCGTDTPIATFYIPASSHFNFRFDTPFYTATGLGYCLTGAGADADTTALVAGDVLAMNVIFQ